jgi:hypothetical protein
LLPPPLEQEEILLLAVSTGQMQRSNSGSATYVPVHRSPLATHSSTPTEQEEEDEEDDDDIDVDEDVFLMEDIDDVEREIHPPGLEALTVESLYRAGTPTPVVSPPFPQVTLPGADPPTRTADDEHEAMTVLLNENLIEMMTEEELAFLDTRPLEPPQELSADELDTECPIPPNRPR